MEDVSRVQRFVRRKVKPTSTTHSFARTFEEIPAEKLAKYEAVGIFPFNQKYFDKYNQFMQYAVDTHRGNFAKKTLKKQMTRAGHHAAMEYLRKNKVTRRLLNPHERFPESGRIFTTTKKPRIPMLKARDRNLRAQKEYVNKIIGKKTQHVRNKTEWRPINMSGITVPITTKYKALTNPQKPNRRKLRGHKARIEREAWKDYPKEIYYSGI
jgi:hypothetical protein